MDNNDSTPLFFVDTNNSMAVSRIFATVKPHVPLIKFRKGSLIPKSVPPPPIETEAVPKMQKTIQISKALNIQIPY